MLIGSRGFKVFGLKGLTGISESHAPAGKQRLDKHNGRHKTPTSAAGGAEKLG